MVLSLIKMQGPKEKSVCINRCDCDARRFRATDVDGDLWLLFKGVAGHKNYCIEQLMEWDTKQSSNTYSFLETWKSLLITSPDRIRWLSSDKHEGIHGFIDLPNEEGRAMLETAPSNRFQNPNRQIRGCGKCLVTRIILCHLMQGRTEVMFHASKAKEYYMDLGFECIRGKLVIDESGMRMLVETYMESL